MSAVPVLVCAFDPVAELSDASGLLVLGPELAHRLIAEHRVEAVTPQIASEMRFVTGSSTFLAARQALRDARASATPAPRPRKVAKLEQ